MNVLCFSMKFSLTLIAVAAFLGCMEKPVTEITMPTQFTQPIKTVKPGAAVKLVSSALISITANDLTNTNIILEVMEPDGELIVGFLPSQGLSLEGLNTPQVITLDSSSPIKIPVSLRATTNGRYYLNMHISLKNADTISVRNLAVIVQVGPLVDKAVKLQKTDGENITVLPAQETISTQ
jgi:hypothetical protein